MKDETIERIIDVDISETMMEKYREYATTVVTDRALADVRDGLKPVHRRIIYGMKEGGYDWTKGYWKSARIVGDVMGKYHPHGDSSIYDAMTRLTQPWSLSVPLIDGQGNFGSPDGDGAAAMRYTEARLADISRHLIEGIDQDTVDFKPNYDGKDSEPVVLPAAFPNVLVNGGSGIAVGMAESIPPHNIKEVINATLLRIRDPKSGLDEVMAEIQGPDFPTGAKIVGREGIRKAYVSGRGTVDVEAVSHYDKDGKTPIIVYTEFPWGVQKPRILARINEMISENIAPDIVSARDETGRDGERFVVELRAGADPQKIDTLLKTQTELRISVSLNFTLLDSRGTPKEMGVIEILDEWIGFRRLTIRRRSNHELTKLRDKGRLLLGRMAALSVMDKAIKMIRAAENREEAMKSLCSLQFSVADFDEIIMILGTKEQRSGKRFNLDEKQADDILNMRLQRLTGMEREGLLKEAEGVVSRMKELRLLLSDPALLDEIIITDLTLIRDAFGVDRKTEINKDAVVEKATFSAPVVALEKSFVMVNDQNEMQRSKKGVPEGFIGEIIQTDTHSKLVLFMRDGNSYGINVADVPSLEDKAPFRSLTGITGNKIEGQVASVISLSAEEAEEAEKGGAVLTFVSEDGAVRRTHASEFARIPQPGKMAMKISGDDPKLLTVFKETGSGGGLFMGTAEGKVIRFALKDVRVMAGRGSRGVRGMKLEKTDIVVSAFEVPDLALSPETVDGIEKAWLAGKSSDETIRARLEDDVVVQLSETGYAKKTVVSAYRQTNRDNRGVNDRGPAKGIGRIASYALIPASAEIFVLRTPKGHVSITSNQVKKNKKGSTGTVIGTG